jgi:hypothetical protein
MKGPCGEEWDYEYDGVTDMSPWGNPQADGISVACKDSLVEKNASLNLLVPSLQVNID